MPAGRRAHVEAGSEPRLSSQNCSLEFTEELKGFVAFGERDHKAAFARGKDRENAFTCRLTIFIDDVDGFMADPDRLGRAAGYVECEDLGGQLPVQEGWFNLFVDAADAERSYMHYRLWFSDELGGARTLVGFKEIRDDPGFDAWEDTSTLYVDVHSGHLKPDETPSSDPAVSGLLRIHPVDFAQQLASFRTSGPTVKDRAAALAAFNKLFLGKLWRTYRGLIRDSGDSAVDIAGADAGDAS